MEIDLLKRETERAQKIVTSETERAINAMEEISRETGRRVSDYASPVRNTILKRFPILFAILVAFGLAATSLGLEKIILQYHFLSDSPWFILLLGISILVFTGTLYKKLD